MPVVDTISYTITPNDSYSGLYSVRVTGKIEDTVKGKAIYIAAAPAVNYTAYSASGATFPSKEIAFDNTPNYGEIDKSFDIYIQTPNAYNDMEREIGPEIIIMYNNGSEDKQVHVPVGTTIPYRNDHQYQDNRRRLGPLFYGESWKLPVKTQEQYLRDSGYPQVYPYIVPDNWWGLKPSN